MENVTEIACCRWVSKFFQKFSHLFAFQLKSRSRDASLPHAKCIPESCLVRPKSTAISCCSFHSGSRRHNSFCCRTIGDPCGLCCFGHHNSCSHNRRSHAVEESGSLIKFSRRRVNDSVVHATSSLSTLSSAIGFHSRHRA